MKLGVHRPNSGTYALRPSPATALHVRHVRAFGLPSTGDEPPEPYVTFTLLEAVGASQPSARIEALSHADHANPVWHDDLRLMLAAGTVWPPLVRVEVRQAQASCKGSARAKSPPSSSGPTLWADRAAASASRSDGGEAAQQADALLGSAAVRLADAGRGKVVALELAGEGRLPSFRLSFTYEMCRALPRRLTLRNVAAFGVPEAIKLSRLGSPRVRAVVCQPYVRFSLVTEEGRSLVTSLVGVAADVSHTGLEPRIIRPQTSGLADLVGTAAVPNQEAGTEADTEACFRMVAGDPVWRRELELIVPAELEGSPLRLRAQLMTRDLGGDSSQVSTCVGRMVPRTAAGTLQYSCTYLLTYRVTLWC